MVHLLDALYQEIGITNICILYFTNFSWFIAGPIYSRDYVLKDRDHWSIAKTAYIPGCSSLFHYVSVKLFFIFFWGLRWKSLKMLEMMCFCWIWAVFHVVDFRHLEGHVGLLMSPLSGCSRVLHCVQGVHCLKKWKPSLMLKAKGQWSNGNSTFISGIQCSIGWLVFLVGLFVFFFGEGFLGFFKGLNNVI